VRGPAQPQRRPREDLGKREDDAPDHGRGRQGW
jgi:hypothetical protein